MLRYLLDTNIAIFVLRSRPAALQARFVEARGQLAISSISVAELAYGGERSARPADNHRAVEEFLALLDVLDFDTAAASHSGQIRAALGAAGTPIGSYDVLVAGHARSRGLAVVTNNTREFERVPGLLIDDWSS